MLYLVLDYNELQVRSQHQEGTFCRFFMMNRTFYNNFDYMFCKCIYCTLDFYLRQFFLCGQEFFLQHISQIHPGTQSFSPSCLNRLHFDLDIQSNCRRNLINQTVRKGLFIFPHNRDLNFDSAGKSSHRENQTFYAQYVINCCRKFYG